MRVIVCGSRSVWHDLKARNALWEKLDDLWGWHDIGTSFIVVHGACPESPDAWAQDWCDHRQKGAVPQRYPADWTKHGKAAGFIRNEKMAEAGADLCIAVWDGSSSGTLDMIERSIDHEIPVHIIPAKIISPVHVG